jgi:branched-chain amino acid transport system permease protein
MTLLSTAVGIISTGAAYAMILYIAAVGLSVTMGLLGIANLAHGAFAMAGGYAMIWVLNHLDLPFGLAVLFACLFIGAVSVVMERLLYCRFYARPELDQVVMSVGLLFMSVAIAQFLFGPSPLSVRLPAMFTGSVNLVGTASLPVYRAFLIFFGVATFLLLWVGIERTMLGARIRAAVDNRFMAQAVGVNTRLLFITVFALGSMLAALGGALGADMMALTPDYALVHLVYFLIVVAVGGLGSVRGPFFAALLLGIGDTACRILAPQAGAFFVYVALFVLLLLRPRGLFGRAT